MPTFHDLIYDFRECTQRELQALPVKYPWVLLSLSCQWSLQIRSDIQFLIIISHDILLSTSGLRYIESELWSWHKNLQNAKPVFLVTSIWLSVDLATTWRQFLWSAEGICHGWWPGRNQNINKLKVAKCVILCPSLQRQKKATTSL